MPPENRTADTCPMCGRLADIVAHGTLRSQSGAVRAAFRVTCDVCGLFVASEIALTNIRNLELDLLARLHLSRYVKDRCQFGFCEVKTSDVLKWHSEYVQRSTEAALSDFTAEERAVLRAAATDPPLLLHGDSLSTNGGIPLTQPERDLSKAFYDLARLRLLEPDPSRDRGQTIAFVLNEGRLRLLGVHRQALTTP